MKRWFKQLLSLTCALALFSSLNFALAFTDVPNSHWASSEIQFIVNKGLFNGTTATTFSPDAQMKRGQLAAVLYRYAGSPAVTGESGYGDVTTGAYYADACAWAKANGIFMAEKLNAANLNPDEGITRSEFAVMLYNFAKLNGKADVKSNASNPYTDMKNVSEEIQTAVIGWAVPAGILGGTTDTTMNPYGAIKRAHVAAMLYRYETKIANPGSEPAPTKPTTEPKPAETKPTTTPTTAKSTYGAGDTVAPMNGGAYTVEIAVGEKCYMDGSKLHGDWTEYYANKWNEAGKEIAQAPWDSAKGMAAITGLAVGTTTIEYLSTEDYETVLATIKVTVTEAGTRSGSGSNSDSGSLGDYMEIRNEIVRLTNEVRRQNGVAELPTDDALMRAAQAAAEEYAKTGAFYNDHDSKMEAQMCESAGVTCGVGSNLTGVYGVGTQAAESAVENWVNSAGHYRTMVASRFGGIGVGVAERNGVKVCVQFFGNYNSKLTPSSAYK